MNTFLIIGFGGSFKPRNGFSGADIILEINACASTNPE
jgi:hypothetical protein